MPALQERGLGFHARLVAADFRASAPYRVLGSGLRRCKCAAMAAASLSVNFDSSMSACLAANSRFVISAVYGVKVANGGPNFPIVHAGIVLLDNAAGIAPLRGKCAPTIGITFGMRRQRDHQGSMGLNFSPNGRFNFTRGKRRLPVRRVPSKFCAEFGALRRRPGGRTDPTSLFK